MRSWGRGISSLTAGVTVALAAVGCSLQGVPSSTSPGSRDSYRVWVASESVDQIALIEFDGREATVIRSRAVGTMPVEIDGPHGVAASPDGAFIYVTLGHGIPFGWLLKLDATTGEMLARAPLGLFPATASVTPDGQYAFVSNFNLHGDPVPSSISRVQLGQMVEIGRTETCVMPHGSRVNPQGTRHYSVCMMDERLIEIDVASGEIHRSFSLRRGMEGPADGPGADTAATMDHAPAGEVCSPTWAEPSTDGSSVFVTCNRAGEVLEVDVGTWRVVRRFSTGDSPYNLAVTPDGGFLLVTLRNRTDPALEVYDPEGGRRLARIRTSTTLPHGIAVSADSRYAFVSVEGVGSEPGKVDIVDLARARLVTSVEVGQQATGIAVLPQRP
jgi:DNA-binding beta-propeller fold protein YncE